MLFHISIAAQDPRRVASVFAELWGGDIMPFPQVARGSWMALAGDDRGTLVEVYPAGVRLTPGEVAASDPDAETSSGGYTATHAAVATRLSQAEVMRIAAREGWPAAYYKRGGLFGVIELWIEGRQMIEVLTPEMQAEYLACLAPAKVKQMLAAAPA